MSNVEPFDNPGEKYAYFHLPWPCRPQKDHSHAEDLGHALSGERSQDSLYFINFRRTIPKIDVCGEKVLSKSDIDVS